MYFQVILAVLIGFLFGTAVMHCLQRRQREKELRKIVKLTEGILNGREMKAVASGEETLYAKIEYRLVRVQEQLQGRRDAAEKSRDEIQKLISEIAHQMRTPLMNIETYLGFLQENLVEEEPLKYVTAIEISERKLYFLVESFIKMSRLEHYIIQIKKEEKDILKTVRNCLGQIQSQAEVKQIQFEISFPQTAACMHDANWLGEAIYNILDNAVKYSETGGKIEISVSDNGMFLKIQIRDYGIGIESGEENCIFKRFYRGKRVSIQEGFGIGLYLTREIVNKHGGFLVVKRGQPGLIMEMNLLFNC